MKKKIGWLLLIMFLLSMIIQQIYLSKVESECKNNQVIVVGSSIGKTQGPHGIVYNRVKFRYRNTDFFTQTKENVLGRTVFLMKVCRANPNFSQEYLLDIQIDSCIDNIIVPDTGWSEVPLIFKNCERN